MQTGKVFENKAGNVAAVNDLYTVSQPGVDSQHIEKMWTRYEKRLAIATAALSQARLKPVPAQMWARILVPFVASLFVRHPSFEQRINGRLARLPNAPLPNDLDNANSIRLMELQFMLAPILAARWFVSEVNGSAPLITNDFGYCYEGLGPSTTGLSIPLNERHILHIVPERARRIVEARSMVWWADIEIVEMNGVGTSEVNRALAQAASRYIYGPTEDVVQDLVSAHRNDREDPPDPREVLGYTYRLCAIHHLVWFHLVTALALRGGDARAVEALKNYDISVVVAEEWHPSIVCQTMHIPMFQPGLEMIGSGIYVDLFDLPGYTDQPSDGLWVGSTLYPGDPVPSDEYFAEAAEAAYRRVGSKPPRDPEHNRTMILTTGVAWSRSKAPRAEGSAP